MFEIRWGELTPGRFEYSSKETDLLPGMLTSEANKYGYGDLELLASAKGVPTNVQLPMVARYRFRRASKTWPCIQLGSGIYTVNQVADGYTWKKFKNDISEALEILINTSPEFMQDQRNDMKLILRYQDVFFPGQNEAPTEYIKEHFNINLDVPIAFTDSKLLASPTFAKDLHFKFINQTEKPMGKIAITLGTAIVNGKPGLLLDTSVESSAAECLSNNSSSETILQWTELAHDLQKHSFKTLVKKEF